MRRLGKTLRGDKGVPSSTGRGEIKQNGTQRSKPFKVSGGRTLYR